MRASSWFVGCILIGGSAIAAEAPRATVLQGGVARWSGLDARECGIFGRRYAAIDGVCFFPVDMKAKTGLHEVALYDAGGKQHLGALEVTARECTETEIELTKSEYIEVSTENAARAAGEREAQLAAVKGEAEVHPRFSLPLGAPAAGVGTQDRSDFCERRLYNGKIKSRHTGLDYPVGAGNEVVAVADGKVVLAADHFYTGPAVYIDHGGQLVSMVFHLQDLAVATGEEVKRGQKIGSVGAGGRTTGPHLHLGARWLGQRIDVAALLRDPARLPGIGEASEAAPDTQSVKADAATPSAQDALGEESPPAKDD